MISEIMERSGAFSARFGRFDAVGVSVGGPVDAERGLILSPPHLPGWDRVPLRKTLQDSFGVPVAVEHDAKACALAEWRLGAGRGTSDMVFLTLGTGIGAAAIVGGRLLRGVANLAGEVGHWRVAEDGPFLHGKSGSLEGWASGSGVAQLAQHLAPSQFGAGISTLRLAELAASGDECARSILVRAGDRLGAAIALLVDLLAPERIVLGNLARRLGDAFLGAALATAEREALPAIAGRCQIVHCELGDTIGDLAALTVAVDALKKTERM